jgi:NAD dependent epimerase/dehydratase
MNLSNETVLVTGAGGFIGSHLTEALIERCAKVKAFLHYNCRRDIGNLEFLSSQYLNDIELVMGNVEDESCVRNAMSGCGCVFHLAALIGIPYSYIAPRSYVATNITGTLNVLESARYLGTSKVIHTSSSEVYGTALYEPIDENHPLQGQSPYSASKIGADKLVESYFRSFQTRVVTLRPFNTYGPRQSARAVIPTIIGQILAGKKIIQLGDLTPKRDLTYVEDTVTGFIKAAESDDLEGKTINLGCGKAISIEELARMLSQQINPSVNIVSRDDRVRPEKSEVLKLISNNTVAAEIMDWHPVISLEDGLRRTTEFIRQNLDWYQVNGYVV